MLTDEISREMAAIKTVKTFMIHDVLNDSPRILTLFHSLDFVLKSSFGVWNFLLNLQSLEPRSIEQERKNNNLAQVE